MGKRSGIIVLLALTMCYVVATAGWLDGGVREREGGDVAFLLQESKQVVKTKAGEMRIVRGGRRRSGGRSMTGMPMHIGFITMEPNSLFIPQYLDSDLILFIRTGEARIGLIYNDDLVERHLKSGDVYRIPNGSPFYLVNTDDAQRLHIICSIDESEGLGWGHTQSFFIGGGTYPTSILAGFDPQTLSTAFNVPLSELGRILTRQQQGPIVFLHESHSPSIWTKFMQMEQHEKKQHLKSMINFQAVKEEEEEETEKEEELIWSFRKLLSSVFGVEYSNADNKSKERKAPHSYNLYNRKPDYRNNYGWTIALDHRDYSPLGQSDIGVYLVNLTRGSMMAPHINPTATEYGIVLRGSGTIQVVYPNGSSAMNAGVKEGDVFWIPQYFPFCQIASESGPFEFFGFTTSASRNKPQFLVGKNSVLETMRGPEFAAGFGVSEKRLRRIIDAQHESVILPSIEHRKV